MSVNTKSNAVAWAEKIKGNKARDLSNVQALLSLGWEVLVVWECEVKDAASTAGRLREFLSG